MEGSNEGQPEGESKERQSESKLDESQSEESDVELLKIYSNVHCDLCAAILHGQKCALTHYLENYKNINNTWIISQMNAFELNLNIHRRSLKRKWDKYISLVNNADVALSRQLENNNNASINLHYRNNADLRLERKKINISSQLVDCTAYLTLVHMYQTNYMLSQVHSDVVDFNIRLNIIFKDFHSKKQFFSSPDTHLFSDFNIFTDCQYKIDDYKQYNNKIYNTISSMDINRTNCSCTIL